MWYVILGEAVAIAVLWGAWQHKKGLLETAEAALRNEKTGRQMEQAAYVVMEHRRAEEIDHLKTELVVTRKALDAVSTPDAVRNDINRLLSR